MNESIPHNAVVLVVDDNEDNRIVAGTNLEMAGYTVLEADRGETGLEVLATTPVDLVLLDIMMPGIDGYEVCRRIRANAAQRHIKVLMLTAKVATSDLVIGFEAGADDYVTKPFEIDELLARVRNLVGLKRAEDELKRINTDLEGEVERRALELARSEAIYRTIFDAVPISIMLLDAQGRIVAVNACHETSALFSALYGPPLAGTPLAGHSGAAAIGVAQRVHGLLEGSAFEHEARVEGGQAAAGQTVVRARGAPITGESGAVEGAVVLHEDLTEERRLQVQLVEAQKLASIGTLTQGVAHNFNNLLFVVTGSLEILRSTIDEERSGRPLEQARAALSRMAALTRQLAAFSRLGEEQRQSVLAGQLLKDVADTLRPSLPANTRLELDVPGDLPPVTGCHGELYQVFHGLTQNAVEATTGGGEIRLSARCEPRAGAPDTPEQPCIVCEVTDTGVGMDEETQRRAFEPFFTSKQTVGVGLGLTAVHGIVRSHGGHIEIVSAPGEGTRVTIILPTHGGAQQPDATAPGNNAFTSKTPVVNRGSLNAQH